MTYRFREVLDMREAPGDETVREWWMEGLVTFLSRLHDPTGEPLT